MYTLSCDNKAGNGNGRNSGELASIYNGPTVRDCPECIRAKRDDQKHYEIVLAALNAYFKPKKYVIFERAIFYRRNQMTGEPAEQFIRALYERCVV